MFSCKFNFLAILPILFLGSMVFSAENNKSKPLSIADLDIIGKHRKKQIDFNPGVLTFGSKHYTSMSDHKYLRSAAGYLSLDFVYVDDQIYISRIRHTDGTGHNHELP